MKIYGIDFTSRPTRRKPITCLECVLVNNTLHAGHLTEWYDFEQFEDALIRPGPWIAGIDFPFGQARTFIENIGWPETWHGYVGFISELARKEFRNKLDTYRANRKPGDKEHRRATDVVAGSISPQKLYGTPVGLMFFEGAPRLRAAGVTIPGLQQGDPVRIVVEAYPGILARTLIGRRSYKQDTKSKQTKEQRLAREALVNRITSGGCLTSHGLKVEATNNLTDDPGGDHLDALLCAIQAAWAWNKRRDNYGLPADFDVLEGWVSDPGTHTD